MSQNNDTNPPREPDALPNASSNLLLNSTGAGNGSLAELMIEMGPQQPSDNPDEGYYGSPPGRRVPARGDPERWMEDATNVVRLSKLPTDVLISRGDIARNALAECMIDGNAVVKLSKLPDQVFIYNLSAPCQEMLGNFFRRHYPNYGVDMFMGVIPDRHEQDVTNTILEILEREGHEQMPYTDIYENCPARTCLFLTDDFPYDGNELVEIVRRDFYGMRRKISSQQNELDTRHVMSLISVRRLAPLVHAMISTAPTPLDSNFLNELKNRIEASPLLDSEVIAFAVEGEKKSKPLEHLVTCVPGVEVVWIGNRKVIRKLELPERANNEQAARAQPTQNASPEAVRAEQDIVKTLSDVLKRPSNLYMPLHKLAAALAGRNMRPVRSLRQFITERPKHFQILGEADYEMVTLSHRAQIKRICNDLQKVLRPRKPKCISSCDVPSEFARHWRSTNEMNRQFNVEDFGVCFLDDLLVTIPQHWGVHCSEYVSTDGQVVRRAHGNGEEDIPDFVPLDASARVYAWIPRHNQTESQKKSLALLKQQTLNMFRGDPSADKLIERLSHGNRGICPDLQKLNRLAYLRANRIHPTQRDASPSVHHDIPPQNVRLPCENLELAERTFVPLYHRFCGEQVTLSHYGVRDLYELFDSMQDLFIASGNGQDRVISLTNEARREILERRCVDILRMSGSSELTENQVLHIYRNQPTMRPPAGGEALDEVRRALNMSRLIVRSFPGSGPYLYRARPPFQCRDAIIRQPDIKHVLIIFMQSHSPLGRAYIEAEFTSRTGRDLDQSVLQDLETLGAIRRAGQYDDRFDLHDSTRIVRNLVYQMNEHPDRIYSTEAQPNYFAANPSHRTVSVASLLLYSGDFTYIDHGTLRNLMLDFDICFERIGNHDFRLRRELAVWPPTAEENENPTPRRSLRNTNNNHRGGGNGGNGGDRTGGSRNRNTHYQRRPGGSS